MYTARNLLFTLAVLMPIALAANSKGKNVADYFSLCSRSDPNAGECIRKSMQEAKPKLINGIPELQLISIDPLRIPRLELKDGQGNFELHMVLKNLTVRGLKDFDIKSGKMDFSMRSFEMVTDMPRLDFDGQYEIAGRILVIPIEGNGDVLLNFTGVRINSAITSNSIQKNGQEYWPVEEFKIDIHVDHGQSHFTNLFNGDKTLGDSTNKFLNENEKEVFQAIKSLPEEAFGQFFKEMGNRIFNEFPIDELYLP